MKIYRFNPETGAYLGEDFCRRGADKTRRLGGTFRHDDNYTAGGRMGAHTNLRRSCATLESPSSQGQRKSAR